VLLVAARRAITEARGTIMSACEQCDAPLTWPHLVTSGAEFCGPTCRDAYAIPSSPGIYEGITHDDYSRIDAVRHGSLKQLQKSPLAMRSAETSERVDTDAFRFGRAVHVAVLEPERFYRDVDVYHGVRRGADWEAFADESSAEAILSEREYELCAQLASAVRSHPVAAAHLAAGTAELTLVWDDPLTGVRCKARPDWIGPSGPMCDLKTTRDVGAGAFGRDAASFGYHTQAAFYLAGWHVLTGELREFVLIAVEKAGAHDVACRRLPAPILARGAVRVWEWLETLADCRASGSWPGCAPAQEDLVFPHWALAEPEQELVI
jgi:hypothetical protein